MKDNGIWVIEFFYEQDSIWHIAYLELFGSRKQAREAIKRFKEEDGFFKTKYRAVKYVRAE